jgi:selenocysteine lyase/cysteine desulfurase
MDLARRQFLMNTGLTAAGLAASFAAVRAEGVAAGAAADTSTWQGVKEQFAIAPDYIHLSSFFLASHPAPVRDAIEKHRRGLDDNPFLYIHNGQGSVERPVAEYVGGAANEIALTDSTTMGLALIYHGLPLRAGQEILTTVHDHYSHHESIRLAAARAGASVREIKLFDDIALVSEVDIVNRVRKAISPRTRVVGVTWVHSSTGLKLPIKAIAEAVADVNRGRDEADRTLLVVDGVHGLGVEDETIAQTGVDFFAAGTHKWIFGPRGTGFIWGKASNWKIMSPVIPSFSGPMAAWMQDRVPGDTQASWMTPGGFHSFEHRWALPAAFEFHKQLGRQRVAERIHSLNDQAKEGLARMPNVTLYTPKGSKLSAGLISFDVKGLKPQAVVAKLLEKKVIASNSPYAVTFARIAPSLLNTPEQIDTALGYIRSL